MVKTPFHICVGASKRNPLKWILEAVFQNNTWDGILFWCQI